MARTSDQHLYSILKIKCISYFSVGLQPRSPLAIEIFYYRDDGLVYFQESISSASGSIVAQLARVTVDLAEHRSTNTKLAIINAKLDDFAAVLTFMSTNKGL